MVGDHTTPWDDDLAYVLSCAALRYQMGRRTYGAGLVVNAVRSRLALFSGRDLWRMADEIDDAEDDLGQVFDAALWRSLREDIVAEVSMREVTGE